MELNRFGIALLFTIELEVKMTKFYVEASECEKYTAAKEAFLRLSREHERQRSLLVRLSREEEVSDSDISPTRLPISGLAPNDYVIPLRIVPQMDYAEVLRLAMEAEVRAGKFHTDLARILKRLAPSASRNFEKLAQENSHYQERLQDLSSRPGGQEEMNRASR